jgi:hypothetical protein
MSSAPIPIVAATACLAHLHSQMLALTWLGDPQTTRPTPHGSRRAFGAGVSPRVSRRAAALHPARGRTSRARIVHLFGNEVVNFGAMIFVVRQAFVYVRTLKVREASADFIDGGTVDDESDDVVYTNPCTVHAGVSTADIGGADNVAIRG